MKKEECALLLRESAVEWMMKARRGGRLNKNETEGG